MKPKILQLAAAAAMAVAVAATAGFAQPIQTLDAGNGLLLHQAKPRAWVREPSGEVVDLALPPGTVLRRLESLAGGWIAAGEIEAPGMIDLFLMRSDGDRLDRFPAPPNAANDPLRGGPMPLVEDGRLAGLAWLAGAGVRQMAVYASQWSGLDWSQPELVSTVGPGTQIAIDGAVLADGSWLLVWSAYDGSDDEIRWSRRVAGRWSEPTRLHEPNEVPDITPALVVTGRGALAAWNWFDGRTYRVRLARFEDGNWLELGFDSPPGAVHPELTRDEAGVLLLYRTVVPPTWTVHELDERGTAISTGVVYEEMALQPGVAGREGSNAVLEWPVARVVVPLGAETPWQADR